jgi:hypothetical protein
VAPSQALDDDPFRIFDENGPQIAPSQNEALERVRDMQAERRQDDDRSSGDLGDESAGSSGMPEIVVPTPDVPAIVPAGGSQDNESDRNDDGRNGDSGNSNDPPIVTMPDMPDVDAMIEDITRQAMDPNRNPNVPASDRPGADRDDNSRPAPTVSPSGNNKKKPARGRDNDRNARKTPTPTNRSVRNDDNNDNTDEAPVIQPAGRDNSQIGQNGGECRNPFSNLPEDMQPKDWPFGDC